MPTISKASEEYDKDLQIQLDNIIERTKTQNRVLNKILDRMKEKETVLDKVNEPNLMGKKQNNNNQ